MTPIPTEPSRAAPAEADPIVTAIAPRAERVPPEAEDFAHVLRRLLARRAADRATRAGLSG